MTITPDKPEPEVPKGPEKDKEPKEQAKMKVGESRDGIRQNASGTLKYISPNYVPPEQISPMEFIPKMILESRDPDKKKKGISEPDKTLVLFGKRGTGKTFLLRWIMSKIKNKFRFGLIFTRTKINGFWQSYLPEALIHDGFNPLAIQKLIKKQGKLVKAMREMPAEESRKINPYVFVILDDIVADNTFKYSEVINTLFAEGRHYKIFVAITSQYAKAVNTMVRGNTDWAFFFKQWQNVQKEAIWRDYFDMLPKDEGFWLIDKMTNGRDVMALNTAVNSTDLRETLFKVTNAVDPGPFRLLKPKVEKKLAQKPTVRRDDKPQFNINEFIDRELFG